MAGLLLGSCRDDGDNGSGPVMIALICPSVTLQQELVSFFFSFFFLRHRNGEVT